MRILHVEKFLPPTGGVGSYIRRLAELQRSDGHEVLHFGCAGGEGGEMPSFFDFTAARGPLALGRMIHNNRAAANLEAFLRRNNIDVAHLHNIYHHLTPSILPVLARRRIGIVMTVHDYRLACPTKHFLRADGLCTRCLANKFYHAASRRCAGLGGAALAVESFFQRFFRRYFRWVDLFLCPSRYLRGVLLRTGLPASKAVVSRYVVDTVRLGRGRSRAGGELLYAGRLSDEKAPQMMLGLAEALPQVSIVIAGSGPLADSLQEQVRRRELSNVTLTGHLDRDRLGSHLARATAVVITSRCLENSPLSMLEAMSAGRCVIAPAHPPLMEWIIDGQTGRLFVPGDTGSLVKVAAEVLGDAAGRREMARRARELIARRHDADMIIVRLHGLYEEAIRRCTLRW